MKKLTVLFLLSIFLISGCSNKKEEKMVEPIVVENMNIKGIFESNPEVKVEEQEEKKEEVEPIKKTETELMYVSAQNGLNVREFADKNSKIIDTLPLNTSVLITRDFYVDGWRQIIHNDNKYYIWGEYLSKDKIEPQYKSLGVYKITHYCPCGQCGSGTGITASGTQATVGRTVACNSLSFGTKIIINGNIYTVEDTGGMNGNTIDIFVSSHQEALNKGVYYADVYTVN